MRSLFWCSAVVVLLAGCGGKASPDPFGYDPARPLAVRDSGVALSGPKLAMHVVSYAGVGRVNAFVIVPRGAGRHPAVLFLHGSGGNREDLLLTPDESAATGILRRVLAELGPQQAVELLLDKSRDTTSNGEFLRQIQRSAQPPAT